MLGGGAAAVWVLVGGAPCQSWGRGRRRQRLRRRVPWGLQLCFDPLAAAVMRLGGHRGTGVGPQGLGRHVQASVGVRGGCDGAGLGGPRQRWGGGRAQLREGAANIATQFNILK